MLTPATRRLCTGLPRFFCNFAVFRVMVDICFYLGHRALHVNPTLYDIVHKRHHTDFTVNLQAQRLRKHFALRTLTM